MRRGRSFALLAGVAGAGLAAGILVPGGGNNAKASGPASPKAVVHVTVSASESRCTLSKRRVPSGKVVFAVTDKGKLSHAFRIAGKTTPLLAPGHSTMLRVTFSKKGRYPYLCTGLGRAVSGMKGVLSVLAPTPTPTTTTAPVTTETTTVATSTTLGTTNTRVSVIIVDSGHVLSPKTMRSGMVTFVIENRCLKLGGVCSFNLEGIKAGAHLNPGESETWTVALLPGTYSYHCDMAPTIMKGSLIVTP